MKPNIGDWVCVNERGVWEVKAVEPQLIVAKVEEPMVFDSTDTGKWMRNRGLQNCYPLCRWCMKQELLGGAWKMWPNLDWQDLRTEAA